MPLNISNHPSNVKKITRAKQRHQQFVEPSLIGAQRTRSQLRRVQQLCRYELFPICDRRAKRDRTHVELCA